MKTWFLAMLGVLLGFLRLQAQLTEGDTLRWKGQASLSSSWTQGNVERYLGMAEASASHHRRPLGFQSSLRYVYGTFGSFRTENDWSFRGFAYLRPERRVYPFFMGLSEGQLRRQIDYRLQAGLGVSVWALRSAFYQLKFSLSGTVERTDYAADWLEGYGALTDRRLETPRLTARAAGQVKLNESRLHLNYEAWWQQSVLHADNQRLFVQAGLNSRLSSKLSLHSRLIYLWESWVPPRVAAYDLLWTLGLTLSFQSRSAATP